MKTEESDEEMILLYEWVDSMPLSRAKQKIHRDFSDGVLMAEVLKYLYPKYVDLNNYPEVHSIKQKHYNWNTLNNKVFKKLNINLNENTIQKLANAEKGVIEKVLKKVYNKVKEDECSLRKIGLMQTNLLPTQKKKKEEIDYKEIIFEKEMEIVSLKEKLKKVKSEIKQVEEENKEIKLDITKYQKLVDIEKTQKNT